MTTRLLFPKAFPFHGLSFLRGMYLHIVWLCGFDLGPFTRRREYTCQARAEARFLVHIYETTGQRFYYTHSVCVLVWVSCI